MAFVILTTSNVAAVRRSDDRPYNAVGKKIGVFHVNNVDHHIWSTGLIEKAMEAGHTVLIATSRTKLFEHDQWFIDLVGQENVFCADEVDVDPDVLYSMTDRERDHVRQLANSGGWIRAFAAAGVPWPEDHAEAHNLDTDTPPDNWMNSRHPERAKQKWRKYCLEPVTRYVDAWNVLPKHGVLLGRDLRNL